MLLNALRLSGEHVGAPDFEPMHGFTQLANVSKVAAMRESRGTRLGAGEVVTLCTDLQRHFRLDRSLADSGETNCDDPANQNWHGECIGEFA